MIARRNPLFSDFRLVLVIGGPATGCPSTGMAASGLYGLTDGEVWID